VGILTLPLLFLFHAYYSSKQGADAKSSTKKHTPKHKKKKSKPSAPISENPPQLPQNKKADSRSSHPVNNKSSSKKPSGKEEKIEEEEGNLLEWHQVRKGPPRNIKAEKPREKSVPICRSCNQVLCCPMFHF
jgi:hypothetical protein